MKRGIDMWTSAKLSYDDDKIKLLKNNLFDRAYAFHVTNVSHTGQRLNLLPCLTKMINSGRYAVGSTLLTLGTSLHLGSSSILWKHILGEKLTQDEVEILFFDHHRKLTDLDIEVLGLDTYEIQRQKNRLPPASPIRMPSLPSSPAQDEPVRSCSSMPGCSTDPLPAPCNYNSASFQSAVESYEVDDAAYDAA